MAFNRSHPGQGSGSPRYPGSFLLAFREAVANLNWKICRWHGVAVECLDAEGREQLVGLENLYRRARQEDRASWPELIAGFLGSVPDEQLENPPTDLAQVAEKLLVRVGAPLGKRGELVVWHQPLVEPGLSLNLVIDYPQSMSYVTEEMVAGSGRPGSDWLKQALDNLSAQTPADCLHTIDEDSGLRQCAVGDAYDSSRALLLDRLLPESAADGYLVAIPGRDQLLVLPVTAAGLAYLPLLKALAEKAHKTAPYSISDEIFWVRAGRWHLFRVDIRGDNVTVQPPQEFLEILKRLAPVEEGGNSEAQS
jgi:hypothetical protein